VFNTVDRKETQYPAVRQRPRKTYGESVEAERVASGRCKLSEIFLLVSVISDLVVWLDDINSPTEEILYHLVPVAFGANIDGKSGNISNGIVLDQVPFIELDWLNPAVPPDSYSNPCPPNTVVEHLTVRGIIELYSNGYVFNRIADRPTPSCEMIEIDRFIIQVADVTPDNSTINNMVKSDCAAVAIINGAVTHGNMTGGFSSRPVRV
jgi:hypothetical protein